MSSLEHIKAQARAALDEAPVTRRWWWAPAWMMAFLGATLAVCAVVMIWQRHPRTGSLTWWLTGVAYLGAAGSAAVAALHPGRRGMRWLAWLLAAAGTLGAYQAAIGPGAPFWHDFECALVELAVSALPAGLAIHALADFAYQPGRALLAGLAAASTGWLALHLTCPVAGVHHLVGFHVMPGLLVTLGLVGIRARVRSRSQVP